MSCFKKKIILLGELGNCKEIYELLLSEYSQIKNEFDIIYLPSNPPSSIKINIFNKIARRYKQVSRIGLFKLIYLLLTKNSIVISEGGSNYLKYFTNNLIFLNHGWGTKKTPGNNEIYDKNLMERYKTIKKISKSIICLSPFDETYYLEHPALSDISKPTFVPLGMPRNDYLIKNKNNIYLINELRDKFNAKKVDKLILYAPTHRESEQNNKVLMERLIGEFSYIDKYLAEKNIKILFRPHYYNSDFVNYFDKYKNIIYVGHDKYKDVRNLMLVSDALITDYSSIFVDYLLLDKPIIFYGFDVENYSKLRGLVIDYDNDLHTPGPKINELKELLSLDINNQKYDLLKSKHFYHKNIDCNSTKRIIEYILEQLRKTV